MDAFSVKGITKKDFETLLEEALLNPNKQYKLGEMYLFGFSLYESGLDAKNIQDNEEARKWLLKAIESHHIEAYFLLGVGHYNGMFGAVNFDQAKRYFSIAKSLGSAKSNHFLGKILNIKNKGKVTQREVNYYGVAAKVGYKDSQYEIALMYCMELLKDDEKFSKAIFWAERAAQQGHYESQLILKQLKSN